MRAGRYKHRVTVQSKSVSLDAVGQEIISWSTVGTYWGLVEDLTGREYLAQGTAETAVVTTRVILRAHVGVISPTSRLVWGDHTYAIRSVLNRHETDDLEIVCHEVLDA